MPKRLTKSAPRTGDDGTTGLGEGMRVGKDSLRINLMGDLDELNSAIGCVLVERLPDEIEMALREVQNDLFDLGGEISIPGRSAMWDAHVIELERAIERVRQPLPQLREFVIPGGTPAAAACHLARAICRRAERSLVALGRAEAVSALSLQYLNRLSELLFVIARSLNAGAAMKEIVWKPGREDGGR